MKKLAIVEFKKAAPNDIRKQRQTLSAREAADYIGISYWLLLEMTKRQEIPFIAAGSRKLFRCETLDIWLENREKLSIQK